MVGPRLCDIIGFATGANRNSGDAGRNAISLRRRAGWRKGLSIKEKAATFALRGLADTMKSRHVVCMFLLACAGPLVRAKTGGRP